jgi:ParB family chromosome partitioning protein
MQKKALGRGLDSLIKGGIARSGAATATAPMEVPVQPPETVLDVAPDIAADKRQTTVAAPSGEKVPQFFGGVRYLPIDKIERSRYQPRSEFDPEQLRELSASIKQRGVVQPLLVRPLRREGVDGAALDGRYELIAGERRWRAARDAGLTTIPAIVRDSGDQESLELALIENLLREDLNAIEEAHGYAQLAAEFGLTQEEISVKVGRSRVSVTNSIRLLSLPSDVQSWVADGKISVGHAKAILGIEGGEEQRLVAERILKQNLTVRDTEQLVEQLKTGKRQAGRVATTAVKPPQVTDIENRLREKLGTQVALYHGRKKGRIVIEYIGNDELSRLLELLGVENL